MYYEDKNIVKNPRCTSTESMKKKAAGLFFNSKTTGQKVLGNKSLVGAVPFGGGPEDRYPTDHVRVEVEMPGEASQDCITGG